MENFSTYLTRKEHEEYTDRINVEIKRLEAEDNRQNHRIDILEKSMEKLNSIAISVEKLALNIEQLVKQQEGDNARITALEGRDGEKWRTVAACIITAVVGAVVTKILMQMGL